MADQSLTTVLASAGGDAAVSFLKKILGPAGDELSGMIADYIRIHRLGNQIRMFRRSEKMLTEAGFTPKPVAMKTLWPLLEGVSVEDDDSLAEKWAALLANASAGGKDMVEPSFADVLKQLTPMQALILDKLYIQVNSEQLHNEKHWFQALDLKPVRDDLQLSYAVFERCMDNLIRLRLCTRIVPARGGGLSGLFKGNFTYPTTEPTLFGYAFVQACKAPQPVGSI